MPGSHARLWGTRQGADAGTPFAQSLVQAPWQHGLLARRKQDDAAALATKGAAAQDVLADPFDPSTAGQGGAGEPANTILPLPRGLWRRRAAGSPPRTPSPPQAEHPALEAVKARWLGGSRPGARRDGFKVGLVVEGGGMRGVVSGGALQAMHDLGMRCAAALLQCRGAATFWHQSSAAARARLALKILPRGRACAVQSVSENGSVCGFFNGTFPNLTPFPGVHSLRWLPQQGLGATVQAQARRFAWEVMVCFSFWVCGNMTQKVAALGTPLTRCMAAARAQSTRHIF